MRTIIIDYQNVEMLPEPVCAAMGNFDGVHLGHQKLIEECKRHGYKSAVLTFYPHPSVYLKKIPNYPLITPIEHKADLISRMGIDYLIIIKFNEEFADLSKDDFINLMKKMNIKSCVCGYDFTFGKKALGNIHDLEDKFEFYEVKKYVFDNIRVSSSHIRELIRAGEVVTVSKFLGRNYSIRGNVIYGSQKGRTIGFPTANIDYKNYLLPENGVYFVNIELNKKFYFGMCNIGNNPTFNYSVKRRLEVNIFGLDQDLYGDSIEVVFHEKIRDELLFSSKEELMNQLNQDKKKCYELSKGFNYTK